MAQIVVDTNQNLSTLTGLLVNSSAYNSDYSHAGTTNGAIGITTTTPRDTATFTPAAGSSCDGAAFIITRLSTVSSVDLTCQLIEGTTVRATAVIKLSTSNLAGEGGIGGWVRFKFASPYLYGNTNNNWKFRLSTSANSVSARGVSATTLQYIEITSTSQALAANDSLFAIGKGTVSGDYSKVIVTVDTSLALGTTGLPSIALAKGGKLTFGDTQAGSYTLTLNSYAEFFTSDSDDWGLQMGTDAHPLTKDYIQTIKIGTLTANSSIAILLHDIYQSGYNRAPFRMSCVGNYLFNQSSQGGHNSTLASQANSGTNTIVFPTDINLRSGGGDSVVVGSTGGLRNAEIKVTSAYNPATKTATLTTNLSNTHAAGAKVSILNTNCVILNDSVTYYSRVYTGTTTTAAAKAIIHLVNLTVKSFYFECAAVSSTDFKCQYCRGDQSVTSPSTSTGFNFTNRTIEDTVFVTKIAVTTGNDNQITNGVYAYNISNTNYAYSLTNQNNIVKNFYLDGLHCKFYVSGSYEDGEQGASTYGLNWGDNGNGYLKNVKLGSVYPNTVTIFPSAFSCKGTIINLEAYYGTSFIDQSGLDAMLANSAIAIQGLGLNTTVNDDDRRIYKTEGLIKTSGAGLEDTTTRTAGTLSLCFVPSSTNENAVGSLYVNLVRGLKSGRGVDLDLYMRKNSSYGSTNLPTVTIENTDMSLSDTATMTDVTDTFQEHILTGTAGSSDSDLTVILSVPSFTSGAIAYFADMYLNIKRSGDATAVFMGNDTWREGVPTFDTFITLAVNAGDVADAVLSDSRALTTGKFIALS